MQIITTDQWLTYYLKNKIGYFDYDLRLQKNLIGKNLAPYFSHRWQDEIHQHLLQNGLFVPDSSDDKTIQAMCDKNFWGIAEAELDQLKRVWNGPDIPVFIFPLSSKSDQLQVDLGGKSGLAHQDKLFLFVSSCSSKQDLQTLITHEYNHVCRLHYLNQAEKSISLLDSMILEGLAELAVLQRFGKGSLAKWTSIYSLADAFMQWEKNFESNLHVQKENPLSHKLMYGSDTIPKWMGYNLGYHLVTSFAEQVEMDLKQMIHLSSKTILEKSSFSD